MTQSFALKLASMRRNEQDLEKEVRIAHNLKLRFFVNIYECCEMFLPRADLDGVCPSTRGILMELGDTSLDKEVLEQATATGKELDVQWLKECRTWMAQMVYAVSYMHGKGVAHRDLKPQNVLLMRKYDGANANEKEIKLTDFGVSVEVQFPGQQLHERVGTPAYSPTEMAFQIPYTMKCDVYSLGRTFASILQRRKTDNAGNLVLFPDFTQSYPNPLDTLLQSMCEMELKRPSIDVVTTHPFFGQFDFYNTKFETISWTEMEDANQQT